MGNLLQKHQNFQLLVLHSVIWCAFPGIVLNQRIHFVVLKLKSSFAFLGESMKSQKWSKSEALRSSHTFKDGQAEYYTVCPNKCVLKSFKFLAINVDIHLTWTHCILMITFYCTCVDKVQYVHLENWHTRSSLA